MIKRGNVFRRFTLPLAGATPHRFAVTADGQAAYVPVLAGNQTSIYKILNEDQKRKFDNLLHQSQSK